MLLSSGGQRCPAGSGSRTADGSRAAVGRCQNTDIAFGLQRVDRYGQVVGLGAFTELLQGGGLDVRVADVHDQLKAFPEVVCTLHDNVESLDASGGYISLSGDLSLTAFQIQPDQDLELMVHRTSPLMHGRDAAAEHNPNPNVIQVTGKRLNISGLRNHNAADRFAEPRFRQAQPADEGHAQPAAGRQARPPDRRTVGLNNAWAKELLAV